MERASGKYPVSSLESIPSLLCAVDSHPNFTLDFENRYKAIASGVYYWYQFLNGFMQFAEGRADPEQNIFYLFLRDVFYRTNFDPGLEAYFNDDLMAGRITKRYVTLMSMLKGERKEIHPITIFQNPDNSGKMCIVSVSGKEYRTNKVDGYHRIFSALLCGVPAIPYIIQP